MDARALNKGWRLDYHLVTKEHMDIVVDSSIHKEYKGSDHVPVQLKIDLTKVILILIFIRIAQR
jgi:exonuclease III